MSTLFDLKDWIAQGGKICQSDWCDNKYIKKDGDEWVDDDGVKAGLGPEMALADNWGKFGETLNRWKPAKDEYYFTIAVGRHPGIETYIWDGDSGDIAVYNSFNCFKTKEEAEHARSLWLAERELRSLSDGGVWGIHRKRGEFIPYNEPDHILSGYRFSTFKEAQEAIKQLGEEKLKLIFGVK